MMTSNEKSDLFINGTGEQDGKGFVFNNLKAFPIVLQADCSPEDSKIWETLGKPMKDSELVSAIIEDGNWYRVVKGEDIDGNIKYQLQKSSKETAPPEAVEETESNILPFDFMNGDPRERNGQIIFTNGRAIDVVLFEDCKTEAAKALQDGHVISAGIVDNKTVPFQLDELIEQTTSDCPCKIIKGNSPEKGDTYYIWTFPNMAAHPCGKVHGDGKRACTKDAGHDGQHKYEQAETDKEESFIESSMPK